MPRFVLLCLLAAGLRAGVIQGVAVEHASGRPLSRTLIRLEPIPGSYTPPQPMTVRAGRAGQFVFPTVPPGMYRIVAQRLGYATAFYGQRRPEGQAAPIQVTPESQLFAELRLRRLGAIIGTVFDENDVGIPGVTVVAYKASLPLRSAGRATSDDRGVFRVAGLSPGRYWIRTGGHVLEDGTGLLPTWAPQSREVREAKQFEARLDSETPDAYVRPDPGRLFSLRGGVSCPPPQPVQVTLISETGKKSVQVFCEGGYQFENLAPMPYEIVASTNNGSLVTYVELNLQGDAVVPLQLTRVPEVTFDAGKATDVSLTGRRADLAAVDQPVKIELPETKLPPGYWNFNATAGPGRYVESVASMFRDIRRPWRPERPADAHEVFIEPQFRNRFKIVVSDKAGQIDGTVTTAGKRTVAGAPVFLWPVSDTNRRILGGPRETLSDIEGRFRFEGLPPGDYRVLATFDASEANTEIIEEARASTVRVEPSQSVNLDLPLWIAP